MNARALDGLHEKAPAGYFGVAAFVDVGTGLTTPIEIHRGGAAQVEVTAYR